MKASTVKLLKKAGLDPKEFTSESPQSLVGRTVAYKDWKSAHVAVVTGGFGAERDARGSAVFIRTPEGHNTRIERYDLLAVKVGEPVAVAVPVAEKGVEQ